MIAKKTSEILNLEKEVKMLMSIVFLGLKSLNIILIVSFEIQGGKR